MSQSQPGLGTFGGYAIEHYPDTQELYDLITSRTPVPHPGTRIPKGQVRSMVDRWETVSEWLRDGLISWRWVPRYVGDEEYYENKQACSYFYPRSLES